MTENMIFVLLSLAYFSSHDDLQFHLFSCKCMPGFYVIEILCTTTQCENVSISV
jgi:hypothetical protein